MMRRAASRTGAVVVMSTAACASVSARTVVVKSATTCASVSACPVIVIEAGRVIQSC
jgi:hypothetical protein